MSTSTVRATYPDVEIKISSAAIEEQPLVRLEVAGVAVDLSPEAVNRMVAALEVAREGAVLKASGVVCVECDQIAALHPHYAGHEFTTS
ncbi:hypothetical protein [Antrihabitans sp. YC2-6]|uniref:hypothetical protein n=1 Tax=Antrihabitans sp. YC2-6 TaxID=2799498 RepID=UPI0018F700A2|nr:hypothetical protein [Antrihabitans sp. YC2-6]MBJ8348574.1 hypothetical protein [Antrihabitans sp. YC2-6]